MDWKQVCSMALFTKLGFFRSCFGKGHRRLSCFLGFHSRFTVSHERSTLAAEHTGNSSDNTATVLMGLCAAISFRLLKGWFPRKGYIQLTSFIMGISINISWVIEYQKISWEFQELTKAYLIWGQVCFTKKKRRTPGFLEVSKESSPPAAVSSSPLQEFRYTDLVGAGGTQLNDII